MQDTQSFRSSDGMQVDQDAGGDPIGLSFGETRPAVEGHEQRSGAWSWQGFGVRKVAIAVVALLVLGLGTYYGHYWWTAGRYLVSTDDAYVGARNATLSPKVAGYVSQIAFDDNARVKAGDVLLRVDDGDYQLAVQTARDHVAVQEATIARLGKQVVAQQAASG